MKRPACVREDVDLQALNTLAVPARARYFAEVKRTRQIPELWQWAREEGHELLVLGSGSNVVFCEDFQGLVLHVAIDRRSWEVLPGHEAILELGAGENWHEVVMYAAHAGYRGIENLALIPGSVGAAPVQNIGAYGVELSDTLVDVEAFDLEEGAWARFTNEECTFGYRDSRFKREPSRYLITQIRIKLGRERPVNIKYKELAEYFDVRSEVAPSAESVANAVIAVRRAKLPDPSSLPNVGSFFQNPVVDEEQFEAIRKRFPDIVSYPVKDGVKLAAGWMIDQCGWKGYRNGRVGVHRKQALVLVNTGGTGKDILGLADEIAADVRQRFGVSLSIEPRLIPA